MPKTDGRSGARKGFARNSSGLRTSSQLANTSAAIRSVFLPETDPRNSKLADIKTTWTSPKPKREDEPSSSRASRPSKRPISGPRPTSKYKSEHPPKYSNDSASSSSDVESKLRRKSLKIIKAREKPSDLRQVLKKFRALPAIKINYYNVVQKRGYSKRAKWEQSKIKRMSAIKTTKAIGKKCVSKSVTSKEEVKEENRHGEDDTDEMEWESIENPELNAGDGREMDLSW